MLSECLTGRLNGANSGRRPAQLSIHPGIDGSPALDRDLRLDLCRGLALCCILLDHIPNNAFSWLTLRHYGFSDATEVFMFVSGVTCALSYSDVRTRYGWASVFAHTLQRSWEIYAAFLILTMALAMIVYASGSDHLADEVNVRVLLQNPGAALIYAAILTYRPVNTIPGYVGRLIYPINKPDLDPLRLLHFLVIAIVVARFVPRNWRGFAIVGLKGAIRCGERSLETYCATVVLSLLAGLCLTEVSNSIAAQLVVSSAGVAALILFATCLTWIGKRSRQHPKLL